MLFSIIESQARGLPIVSRENNVIFDYVYHNETGFITNDPNNFANKIIDLLTDNSLFLRMNSNAKLNNKINDWNSITSNKNIAIDNFHLLESDDESEFLQFYNELVMNKSKILVAIDPSKNKQIALKDLESRVNSFTSARINDLDDKLLRILIIKYFSNAQIIIDKTVIEFIVSRTERDYLYLFSLLETLNYESLKSKNKITVPFVKNFLTSDRI